MTTAKICDRCKKVESDTTGWSLVEVMLSDRYYAIHRDGKREFNKDLCTDCTRQMIAWLKEPVSLT